MSSAPNFEHLPTLDYKEALSRCMDSKDFLLELSNVFVAETLPQYVPGIQEGVEKKDFNKIVSNSHGLKGGSSAIGLIRIKEMAYALEMAGKNKDLQTIENILPHLLQEVEKVKMLILNKEMIS